MAINKDGFLSFAAAAVSLNHFAPLPFAIDQFFEVLDPAGRVCDDEAIAQPFSGSRAYAEVFAVAEEIGDLHERICSDNNIAGHETSACRLPKGP
jgi:hypothetical protein